MRDLRKFGAKIKAAPQKGILQIGCIVVVNATFFSRDEWIPQPRDWAESNLRHTVYDLDVGEGARVWAECLARVRPDRELHVAESESGIELPRYGSPVLIRPRLSQGAFRVSVTETYKRACAVTHEHSLPALEAAHIRPFAKEGPHEVRMDYCLRADLHRLFEQGYLTVIPDFRLEVSDRLRDDYQNGRSYYPLRGTRIPVPAFRMNDQLPIFSTGIMKTSFCNNPYGVPSNPLDNDIAERTSNLSDICSILWNGSTSRLFRTHPLID